MNSLLNTSMSGTVSGAAGWLRQVKQAALAVCAAFLCAQSPLEAFPPAPHHTIFGLIRDEYGQPLNVTGAEIFLETAAGGRVRSVVIPDLEPGVNYRLEVPMDAGLTDDTYKPTAMRPAAPFRIQVKIGKNVFLPIEMKADTARMGEPGKSTRLNLTLGEDSDGDGLPDAWERALIALTGGKKTLADIRPGDDADKDGLTNLQEYLAGTYAFDPKDGYSVKAVGMQEGSPVLQFVTVTGKTYSIVGSADLQSWESLSFRVVDSGAVGASVTSYVAKDVRIVQVVVPVDPAHSPVGLFKLMVK